MNRHVSDSELAQAQREFGWTDHRVRVVGLLWNGGFTATQVACKIGGVSRNAVIGLVSRKKLADATRPLSALSNGRAKGVRSTPLKPKREAKALIGRLRLLEPPPPHIDDQAIAIGQRRTLLQLTDACCHWPVGEPGSADFFYCGAVAKRKDKASFHPYCASHLRRAHQPAWRRPAGTENPHSKLSLAKVNHHARR